ncbi:hypothetical protein F5B20DRAFT_390965 [Whalleya microplaca]|nr:hypothetical protein F5B20DRAFT_390965 [Whalleya microplaca]
MQAASLNLHSPPPTHPTHNIAANDNGNEAARVPGTELTRDDTDLTAHSGRLVYAKPEDLPSFPSIGLAEKGAAASAAATLGWTNTISPELWKPDKSASASAAAVMAKDYKLAPLPTSVPSQHGAKAALHASQSAKTSVSWKPTATDHGYSAANMAFRSDRSFSRTSGVNNLEHRGSLLAAKGAMANRQRAKSTPTLKPKEAYPDEANAAANALSAATHAHRPARSLTTSAKGGALPIVHMDRQMFTSHPPVKAEVEEQKRTDVLHASALAMAKKMFDQQQKMIDAKKRHDGAVPPREQFDNSSSISDDAQPIRFTSLQDAAYKQAQARLTKIHEENIKDRDYRDYYGAGQGQPTRRFTTIRGKFSRRRSSSDGDVIEDRKRSQAIRQQMSLFSSKLSEVDLKKQQQDQEALFAAAQRNVHLQLKGMDEKISAETGMAPPSTLTQWELKAHAAAQARSDDRVAQRQSKINVGGKWMTQEEINEIAARRVQPVLDEINEKAEQEHARQTELRLEAERQKEQRELEKARDKEVQELQKKLREQEKDEQKEKKAEEKQEAQAKKEERKAAKAELKRLAKVEKHKSVVVDQPHETQEEQREQPEQPEQPGPDETVAENTVDQPVAVAVAVAVPVPAEDANATTAGDAEADVSDQQPTSPGESSPKGKVKTWFKHRFSRGPKSPDGEKSGDKSARKSFIGGAALSGTNPDNSTTSLDNPNASVHAVAMAGRDQNVSEQDPATGDADAGAVSPANTSSDEEQVRDEEMRRTPLSPPKPLKAAGDLSLTNSSSPRDSRFHEVL